MENFTTILFGNGLGRAIDNNHFDLMTGLKTGWEQLPEQAKQKIESFLGIKSMPESEDDLFTVQKALFSITELEKYENQYQWTTSDAKEFKNEFQEYVINVAAHFFRYDEKKLKPEFVSNLSTFIKNNSTHIATLNYDKLLYDLLLKEELIGKGMGIDRVCDGMWTTQGFHSENLERKFNHNFGWYLHLHGSPLFYSANGGVFKDSIPEFENNLGNKQKQRDHLVLTHSKHKPLMINKSSALEAYWDYFEIAIKESNCLIIFGYSGKDIHINSLIKQCKQMLGNNLLIKIIEYKNKSENSSKEFWNSPECLGGTLDFAKDQLIQLPSILDYSFS